MKKIFWIFAALLGFSFVACSEDATEDEFEGNWKERNAAFFDSIATVARTNQGTEVGQWRVIQSFHLLSSFTSLRNEDYVFAQILHNGTGTDRALYTDSVDVNYRLRLIPSVSYPQGKVSDQNFYGELVSYKNGSYVLDEENAKIMVPSGFMLNGLIDGWKTALQQMHEGDIWRLYVPENQGYSTKGNDNVPGYSTLVFDVFLRKIIHK